jgi:hypothetical protein
MNQPFVRLLVASSLVVLLAACSSGAAPGATPAPTSSAAASSAGPDSSAAVDSPEAAIARVVEVDSRFEGIQRKNPDLIGQCCFYEVQAAPNGYTVTIEVGWGDCPSGCIDRHRWVFGVARTGEVALQSETGDDVPAGLPGSGTADSPASS